MRDDGQGVRLFSYSDMLVYLDSIRRGNSRMKCTTLIVNGPSHSSVSGHINHGIVRFVIYRSFVPSRALNIYAVFTLEVVPANKRIIVGYGLQAGCSLYGLTRPPHSSYGADCFSSPASPNLPWPGPSPSNPMAGRAGLLPSLSSLSVH